MAQPHPKRTSSILRRPPLQDVPPDAASTPAESVREIASEAPQTDRPVNDNQPPTSHLSDTIEVEGELEDVSLDDDRPSPHSDHDDTPANLSVPVPAVDGGADSPITPQSKSQGPSSPIVNPPAFSEWSHQVVAPQPAADDEDDNTVKDSEDEWQEMPSLAPYDMYDDDGKLIARESAEESGDPTERPPPYQGLGMAASGYTRVQVDEDARSATSMDDNTAYLFKEGAADLQDENEDLRDVSSQMQATKKILNDTQRIAYVGIVKLAAAEMRATQAKVERSRAARKEVDFALEALSLWSQKMMVRLYRHMELANEEQIMIEQLAEHKVKASDLTPTLMASSRIKNPVAAPTASTPRPNGTGPSSSHSPEPEAASISQESSTKADEARKDMPSTKFNPDDDNDDTKDEDQLPPYRENQEEEDSTVPPVSDGMELVDEKELDIDLRWTVLCDLFLVLISDSMYDSRSRVLLETVAGYLDIPWLDVCRFEKRVTEALEMEEEAQKEHWNEAEHMEERRKRARRRRLALMGLATVGGGLVIGLTAGLMAPLIGAGLAAGFTTIGVTGTSTFLAGAGGAAVIGTIGTATGGTIGVRAANRRTGAVRTFEYRPLHNKKRVNLILTVAGWMHGKVDDVRLPFSTIDPVMGDLYSVLWEPEMLRSMGDTINILATEALTQGLQQILGSTILITLMAALQAPILLTKLSYLIDNPWSVSLARAEMAGLILADSLVDRNLGARPITLVGFSLGSKVIFSCLRELARKGAVGLIQNVYLFGSPVVVGRDDYLRARTVVSGRFLNGYAKTDWILGYLFRATSGGLMRVAGLAELDIPTIENFDCTPFVPGHMSYRKAMPRLLREVGWAVESDDFTEIEDPDPDDHEKRQRELITEIEEARRELEAKPERRRFNIFRRGKKQARKQEWEMYDDRLKIAASPAGDEQSSSASAYSSAQAGDAYGRALFDVEAIRREAAELAAQGIQIRELKSTMPPMRLDPALLASPAAAVAGSSSSLQGASAERRSFSAVGSARDRPAVAASTSYLSAGHSRDASLDDDGGAEHATSTSTAAAAKALGVSAHGDDHFGVPRRGLAARSRVSAGLGDSGDIGDIGGWSARASMHEQRGHGVGYAGADDDDLGGGGSFSRYDFDGYGGSEDDDVVVGSHGGVSMSFEPASKSVSSLSTPARPMRTPSPLKDGWSRPHDSSDVGGDDDLGSGWGRRLDEPQQSSMSSRPHDRQAVSSSMASPARGSSPRVDTSACQAPPPPKTHGASSSALASTATSKGSSAGQNGVVPLANGAGIGAADGGWGGYLSGGYDGRPGANVWADEDGDEGEVSMTFE